MTGFESFVGVNPWTALFTFCNMLITFAVLKKKYRKQRQHPMLQSGCLPASPWDYSYPQ